MSRELSDLLIVTVAILIPTIAVLTVLLWQKLLAHRERKNAIAAENRELRAELASVKGRVAEVERIVTDDSHRLGQEIESLRLN